MRIFKHPLTELIKSFPDQGKVLDIGALNYSQYKRMKNTHPNVAHYGIDYVDNTEEMPNGYQFKKANLNTEGIPFEADMFDLIVASHVIEHLNEPLNFFKECIRVLKPNGILYIEAPSENSVRISGMNFNYEKFYSLSYYDDPTHTMRPYSPQSFYRLSSYFSAKPIKVGYIKSNWAVLFGLILIPYARLVKDGKLLEKMVWWSKGWAAYLIATKGFTGEPNFHYYIPSQNSYK
jgi:SAM-dependent methyltransferase